jgi:hypothetical protein
VYLVEETRAQLAHKSCIARQSGPIDGLRSSLPARGEQFQFRWRTTGLVDCVATLDFVSEDFARRFSLSTRRSQTKTLVRIANGQRVTSSTVCDIAFELARHEFQRAFYALRYLRVADLVLGLPWLDDEQASL